MNRLERLLNLVAALLDAGRPLSRVEIQRRVPGYGEGQSARRAFERDKDALRAMGIPVVLEPLDRDHADLGEGYRIPPEQYQLPDPHLAPDELAALHLAASTVRLGAGGTNGPGDAATAIWKLGGATGQPGPGAPIAALPGSEHLPVLFASLGERQTVRFGYRSAERVVDPHRLSYTGGHWYLIGHDHDRGEVRNFRLDRMDAAPTAGPAGAFERPAGSPAPAPAPWRMGDEDEVEAMLLVDTDQAAWAEARAGEGAVRERRPDGSVVLALSVTNRAAFRTFALGFLDHAEVLGPPDLRAGMLAWLDGLAAV
ncbi:MAG: helix-turn-helix transcriptional regulator [Acidimicrobiales bacterium]